MSGSTPAAVPVGRGSVVRRIGNTSSLAVTPRRLLISDPVYSNTSGYHPVFGMGDSIVLSVDSNQLIDENNARGSPVDEAL